MLTIPQDQKAQFRKELFFRKNELNAILSILYPEDEQVRSQLLPLITDLSGEDINLIVRLLTIAKFQTVSNWFKDFSEYYARLLLEYKISHKRKGREEAIAALLRDKRRQLSQEDESLLERVRKKFFKVDE